MSEQKKNSGLGLVLKRKGTIRFKATTGSNNNENLDHGAVPVKQGSNRNTTSKSINAGEEANLTTRMKSISRVKGSGADLQTITETLILQKNELTPVKRSARLASSPALNENHIVEQTPSSFMPSLDTRTDSVAHKSAKTRKLSAQDITVDSPVRSSSEKVNVKNTSHATRSVTAQSKNRNKKVSAIASSDSDTEDFVPARNVKFQNRKANTSKIDSETDPVTLSDGNVSSNTVEVQKSQNRSLKTAAKTPTNVKVQSRNQSKKPSKDNATNKFVDNTSRDDVSRNRTPSPRFHLSPTDE